MKRPPGLWVLLSAGVLWLSLQDVYGIRATALIFGKSTTTTTEGTEVETSPSNETVTESSTEALAPNSTKPTLTGNPQVDYIWDPNLPKELNGYNLSEYPFYERVPEDIDFKCDGLHDGFYASVPHKCQVYHHCLFGTRYDFLCANYTAFDQKTFICHFVSEVDCVNSKKYWHRNDALYQAATTTTLRPLIVRTPPPVIQDTPTAVATPPPAAAHPHRRRPLRRRRPQYDYYDYEDDFEYYEERPRYERRRKRPRPRPRPVYDYEEEYEDERYERRGSGRGRRRGSERRRNKDRRKYEDEADDDRRSNNKDRPDDKSGEDRRNNKDSRRKYEDEVDDKAGEDRKSNKERRKHEDEADDKLEEDRRSNKDRRREESSEKRPISHKRRPVDDYEEDRRRSRPKSRPAEDDYEEAKPHPAEGAGDKAMIKPTSGSSIYDRPRAAPKIKPPVPKNEAAKYAYKPIVTNTKAPAAEDEEYYDDYEEEEEEAPVIKEMGEARRASNRHEETRKGSKLRAQPSREDSYEEEAPRRGFKPKNPRTPPRANLHHKKQQPKEEEYIDDDYIEEEVSKEQTKQEPKTEKTTTSTSTTTTTTTTTTSTTPPPPSTTTPTTPKPTTTFRDLPKPDTIVRIVKRPFLPSRGGNPYSPRGLQPVGAKAVDKKPEDETEKPETVETKPFKPSSPVIVKMPSRQKYAQDDYKTAANRPPLLPPRPVMKPSKEYSGPRTTQKPKLPDPDPLDIEDEYDVTLNDALNPTLPNLPVRSFPTGFSAGNDYYNAGQSRPRYVVEGASSDYVYQAKPVRQRYEAVPYTGAQDHFVNRDADYKGQYSTVQQQSFRPRLTQAYYTSF